MTRTPRALDLFCGGGQRRCAHCGIAITGRADKRVCSERCRQRISGGRPKFPYERSCRNCGTKFPVQSRADANRQHCSQKCAKHFYTKRIMAWKDKHHDSMRRYNRNRVEKNPTVWQKKHRAERTAIIAALGGRCLVCGASNLNWLHVDYAPTTRGKPFRHPRHAGYILTHLSKFRLLCANHHYELTLTGLIEGTAITQ